MSKYSPEELRRLYWDENLSLAKIGQRFDVNPATIYLTMKRLGIPVRTHNQALQLYYRLHGKVNKDEAIKLHSEGLSLSKIAKISGVTKQAIRHGLLKIGISTAGQRQKEGEVITCQNCDKEIYRTQSRLVYPSFCSQECYRQFKLARPRFSRSQLVKLYQGAQLSLKQIGELLGIGRQSVQRWLIRYKIPRRAAIHNIPHRAESIAKMEAAHRQYHIFKPTAPERKLIKILGEHNLPYRYVGNGAVWFEGYNPDFINVNGSKGIIEVFGDYWHTGAVKRWQETEGGRTYHFAKFGFKTLILWENELENEKAVVKKIKAFTKDLGGCFNG